MSSPDVAAPAGERQDNEGPPAPAEPPDRLPPALSSMWRLCRLGFHYEPTLMGVAFVLALVAALPDALLAVWFKLLGEGLIEQLEPHGQQRVRQRSDEREDERHAHQRRLVMEAEAAQAPHRGQRGRQPVRRFGRRGRALVVLPF